MQEEVAAGGHMRPSGPFLPLPHCSSSFLILSVAEAPFPAEGGRKVIPEIKGHIIPSDFAENPAPKEETLHMWGRPVPSQIELIDCINFERKQVKWKLGKNRA